VFKLPDIEALREVWDAGERGYEPATLSLY
jgi:hypothetical protein